MFAFIKAGGHENVSHAESHILAIDLDRCNIDPEADRGCSLSSKPGAMKTFRMPNPTSLLRRLQ